MPIETVHDVVAEARASFTLGTRADGSEFWHLTDDAPEWVRDMVYDAHYPTFGPDDYRYLFTVQALDALAECLDDTGSAEDAESYLPQIIGYNEVAAWLASHNGRFWYVDDASELYGITGDTFDRLVFGMAHERAEVLASVMRSIEDRAASLGIEG